MDKQRWIVSYTLGYVCSGFVWNIHHFWVGFCVAGVFGAVTGVTELLRSRHQNILGDDDDE